MRRRLPLLAGALFIVVGIVYVVVQGGKVDMAGTTGLIVLGVVMAFTLYVLMDGAGSE
jgi:hypothetical protein